MKQHQGILLDAGTQLPVLLHSHTNSLAWSEKEFPPILSVVLQPSSCAWFRTGQAPIISFVGDELL